MAITSETIDGFMARMVAGVGADRHAALGPSGRDLRTDWWTRALERHSVDHDAQAGACWASATERLGGTGGDQRSGNRGTAFQSTRGRPCVLSRGHVSTRRFEGGWSSQVFTVQQVGYIALRHRAERGR